MTKKLLKISILVLVLTLLSLSLLACSSDCSVTFQTFDSTEYISIDVAKGGTVTVPDAPTKTGFVFSGWYKNADYSEMFDFSESITKDTVIYAKWLPNAEIFSFSVNENQTSVTITGLTITEDWIKEIVIPSTIDGKTVTAIGDEAFLNRKSLIRVSFAGETVTSIGKYAFMFNINLKSITLPVSLTSIDDGAFASCRSLTEITLPASVTTMGEAVFFDCTSLQQDN